MADRDLLGEAGTERLEEALTRIESQIADICNVPANEPDVADRIYRDSTDLALAAAALEQSVMLRPYLTEEARLVACGNCGGEGGWPDGDEEHHPNGVGCQYCETTGKVIVLPSTLATRPKENPDE